MNSRFEYIEDYFMGKLNPDEQAEFDRLVKKDKEFEREVLLYRQAVEIIKAGAGDRMKWHWSEADRQKKTVSLSDISNRNRFMPNYRYAAAAILLLIGLSLFVWLRISTLKPAPSLTDLYDSYYESPGIDRVIVRSSGVDATGLSWYAALEKYNEKNYAVALEELKRLLSDPEFAHRSAGNLYAGICFLNLNEPDSAVSRLARVSSASSFAQDAEWYIGLSHIKKGDAGKAFEIFEKISKSEKHPYKKEAGKISGTLNRMNRN